MLLCCYASSLYLFLNGAATHRPDLSVLVTQGHTAFAVCGSFCGRRVRAVALVTFADDPAFEVARQFIRRQIMRVDIQAVAQRDPEPDELSVTWIAAAYPVLALVTVVVVSARPWMACATIGRRWRATTTLESIEVSMQKRARTGPLPIRVRRARAHDRTALRRSLLRACPTACASRRISLREACNSFSRSRTTSGFVRSRKRCALKSKNDRS